MQVKKQLFALDNRSIGADVAVKNELRRTIKVMKQEGELLSALVG